jgi:hypothetical protein
MSIQVRYYGDKISKRIAKTPEGFLICQDVPISRTGYQEYLASELTDNPVDKHKIIPVYRPATEVFDIRSLASFEGKPVTNEHPDEDVTPENYQRYSCGHVQNVHAGDGEDSNKVLADLYITDPVLIKLIEKGKREISCGYYAEEKKDSTGKIYQTRIRGNHVAVVQNGRAGNKVCIRDKNPFTWRKAGMRRKKSLSSYIDGLTYLDEDPVVEDDMILGERQGIEDNEEFIGDDDVYMDDDELMEDDDELMEDDDFSGNDDVVIEDDDYMEDDDFEDDDELMEDEDEILEDEDELMEDDDFSGNDDVVIEDDDEEFIGDDDEIDLKEKANEILNDCRRTLMDARRHMKRMRKRDSLRQLRRRYRKLLDAIILNDDDPEEIVEDEDEILEDDDFSGNGDVVLEDADFCEDEDEILEDEDELMEDEDELMEDDGEFEDEDMLEDEDEILEDDDELMEDDEFSGNDDIVVEDDDEELLGDRCADDDVEVTETSELTDSDESEVIDTDKTKALREIAEASRGISDPTERKQLQDAIYKALCGKNQMADVMRITKKNRKARMDAAANKKGSVDMSKQQAIYDSFNPHKKTNF